MGGVGEVTGVEATKCNYSRDNSGRAGRRDRRKRRVRSRGPGDRGPGGPGADYQADRGPAHHYRTAVREAGVRGPGHLGGFARSPAAAGCRPRQLYRSSNHYPGHKPAGPAAADEAAARQRPRRLERAEELHQPHHQEQGWQGNRHHPDDAVPRYVRPRARQPGQPVHVAVSRSNAGPWIRSRSGRCGA